MSLLILKGEASGAGEAAGLLLENLKAEADVRQTEEEEEEEGRWNGGHASAGKL